MSAASRALLLLAVIVGPAAADPPKPVARLTVTETSLGRVPNGLVPGSIVVSPDGTRAAFVVNTGRGHRVVLDGQPQPTFPFVFPKTLRFSPDGKRFGYTVGLNNARKPPSAAVIDGKRGPVFDEFRPSEDGHNLYFSPDSKRVAYVGHKAGKCVPVVDGVEGAAHPGNCATAGVIWSPDSRRWGFMVQSAKADSGFVVIDGQKGPTHDILTVPAGTNLAGTQLDEYAADRGIAFSPDGRHYAYGAVDGETSKLMVDGQEVAKAPAKRVRLKDPAGNPVDATEGGIGNIMYGPTGDRLVYFVTRGTDKQWVVLDGQAQKEYAGVSPAVRFSPDGKHFAYIGISPRAMVVVRDGQEGKTYDVPPEDQFPTDPLAFSPDGGRLAACVRKGGQALVTVDGVDGPAFDLVNRPLFSPDGKRLCHIALKGNAPWVVVDGVPAKAMQDLSLPGPHFSPDSAHVAYGAKRNGRWRIAVDGVETRETYDGIVARTLVRFTDNDHVRAVAFRGTELLRVDAALGYGSIVVTPVPEGAATFGGKSYKFYPEVMTWKQAKAKCEELGGRLALVTNEEQNEFLAKLVTTAGKAEAWLGATDEVKEGDWVWVDGSAMSFKKWGPQQPNNKGNVEHYLLLDAAKKAVWSDQPDRSTQHKPGFICEWASAAGDSPRPTPIVSAPTPELLKAPTPRQLAVVPIDIGASDEASRGLSRDGSTLALYADYFFIVFDVATQKERARFARTNDLLIEGPPCLSPDGRWLLLFRTVGNDYQLVVFDTTDPKAPPKVIAERVARAAAFSPDGKTVAVGFNTGTEERKALAVVEAGTWKEIKSIEGFDTAVSTVNFTPDGALLLIAVKDRKGARLDRFDPKTLEKRGTVCPMERVNDGFVFSSDGKAVGKYGNSGLEFFEVDTGKAVSRLAGASETRRYKALRDLPFVVSGSEISRPALFDLKTGAKKFDFEVRTAHQNENLIVWGLGFSADGRLMASGGYDGEVIFWDVVHGKAVGKLPAHAGQVYMILFTPDGKTMITWGEEKKLKFWALDPAR